MADYKIFVLVRGGGVVSEVTDSGAIEKEKKEEEKKKANWTEQLPWVLELQG